MKKYRLSGRTILLQVLLLFAVANIFPPSALGAEPETAVAAHSCDKDTCYQLKEGKILCIASDRVTALPVPGGVFSLYHGKDGLYYLRLKEADGEGRARCCAGLYDPGTGKAAEAVLEEIVEPGRIRRLQGRDGLSYFLLAPEQNDGPGKLCCVDINAGRVSTRNGIADFILGDAGPVLLEPGEPFYHVNSGGRTLPLLLQGNGTGFREMLDGRICFITDGKKTEIVDVLSMKSLYVYSEKILYAAPGDYNLVVEVVEQNAGSNAEYRVFYRVLIDGVEAGRTDTGPPGTPRIFKGTIDADTSHVVNLERWELNIARKRYERSNNIRQPGPVKIFMPRNIVLGIYLRYDGKNYIQTVQPVPAP